MSPSNVERDIDTDKIERIASAIAHKSDRSDRNDRISNLESEVNAIKENLHDGSIEFVKLRNSIDSLTSTIGTIKTGFFWVIGTVALMGMGFCGSLLWFVVKMYATNGGAT